MFSTRVLNLILTTHLTKTCDCHTCSTGVLNLILQHGYPCDCDTCLTRVLNLMYTYCTPAYPCDCQTHYLLYVHSAVQVRVSERRALRQPQQVQVSSWLHRHSVSDPSVYPCCWLLFTSTQCQIRQYTLVVTLLPRFSLWAFSHITCIHPLHYAFVHTCVLGAFFT